MKHSLDLEIVMMPTIRSTLALALLTSLAACQELPVDTALDLDSGLEVFDEELLHDDELAEVPIEAEEGSAAWTARYHCYTDGYIDTGWVWSGTSTYDLARTRATWSGYSVDGVGSLTVSTTLNGTTYSSAPSTLALTGAVKVNGGSCGSVSVVDRDGNSSAKATGSCTVSWSGSTSSNTVTVHDSSAGMRAEFLRSSGTTRFYVPSSGSSTTYCYWG